MIITPNIEERIARKESGEKGYRLYTLAKSEISVPRFFIIGKSIFNLFQEYSEIRHIIDKELNIMQDFPCTPQNILDAYSTIRKVILDAPVPSDLYQTIFNAYESLNEPSIAIRSSVINVDNSTMSFAGHHSTFLSVTNFVDAIIYLKECWISAFCPSAINYRIAHKQPLNSSTIEMAVIFQKMAVPEKSGILSTHDLQTNNSDSFTIHASYGLPHGISSGKVSYDTCKIDKTSGKITLLSINNKTNQFVPHPEQPCFIETSVPASIRSASCLSMQQLSDLARIGKSVESILSSSQIVEWIWDRNNGFQIIQSSSLKKLHLHIRRSKKNDTCQTQVSAVTYPLFFGFKRKFYCNSFFLLCKSMRLSDKDIRIISPFYENILSSIFGRIYFNVQNLYRLSTFIFPGRNKKVKSKSNDNKIGFEANIASNDKDSTKLHCNPLHQIISAIAFTRYVLIIRSNFIRFKKDIDRMFSDYAKCDFSKLTSNQIYDRFNLLENYIFPKWKVPAINDFLLMTYFRILRTLTYRWFPDIAQPLEKDFLLINNKFSSESVNELSRITHIIRASRVRNSPENNESFYEDSLSAIDPKTADAIIESRKKSIFFSTEDKNVFSEKSAIDNIKLFIYNKILTETRRFAMNRDISGRIKSRIYNIVDIMFKSIGNNLHKENKIQCPDDIYYLDAELLKKAIDETISDKELTNKIKIKKEQYSFFKQMDPPSKIITTGPIYWLNQAENNMVQTIKDHKSDKFRCTGVSNGISEGKIIIADNETDAASLHNNIAVMTGGSSSLLRNIQALSGLIIPETSIYSHYASIAREFGIPVISAPADILGSFKAGMTVRIDGSVGTVDIISNESSLDTSDKRKIKMQNCLLRT